MGREEKTLLLHAACQRAPKSVQPLPLESVSACCSMTKIKRRHVSKRDKERILLRQRLRCNQCSSKLNTARELDHVTPLFVGGKDSTLNMQWLCCNCHCLKTKWDLSQVRYLTRYEKYCLQCKQIFSPWFRHICPSWTPLLRRLRQSEDPNATHEAPQ